MNTTVWNTKVSSPEYSSMIETMIDGRLCSLNKKLESLEKQIVDERAHRDEMESERMTQILQYISSQFTELKLTNKEEKNSLISFLPLLHEIPEIKRSLEGMKEKIENTENQINSLNNKINHFLVGDKDKCTEDKNNHLSRILRCLDSLYDKTKGIKEELRNSTEDILSKSSKNFKMMDSIHCKINSMLNYQRQTTKSGIETASKLEISSQVGAEESFNKKILFHLEAIRKNLDVNNQLLVEPSKSNKSYNPIIIKENITEIEDSQNDRSKELQRNDKFENFSNSTNYLDDLKTVISSEIHDKLFIRTNEEKEWKNSLVSVIQKLDYNQSVILRELANLSELESVMKEIQPRLDDIYIKILPNLEEIKTNIKRVNEREGKENNVHIGKILDIVEDIKEEKENDKKYSCILSALNEIKTNRKMDGMTEQVNEYSKAGQCTEKMLRSILIHLEEIRRNSTTDGKTLSQMNRVLQGLKTSNSAMEIKFGSHVKEILQQSSLHQLIHEVKKNQNKILEEHFISESLVKEIISLKDKMEPLLNSLNKENNSHTNSRNESIKIYNPLEDITLTSVISNFETLNNILGNIPNDINSAMAAMEENIRVIIEETLRKQLKGLNSDIGRRFERLESGLTLKFDKELSTLVSKFENITASLKNLHSETENIITLNRQIYKEQSQSVMVQDQLETICNTLLEPIREILALSKSDSELLSNCKILLELNVSSNNNKMSYPTNHLLLLLLRKTTTTQNDILSQTDKSLQLQSSFNDSLKILLPFLKDFQRGSSSELSEEFIASMSSLIDIGRQYSYARSQSVNEFRKLVRLFMDLSERLTSARVLDRPRPACKKRNSFPHCSQLTESIYSKNLQPVVRLSKSITIDSQFEEDKSFKKSKKIRLDL